MSAREPDQNPAGGAADEPHDVLAADEFPGPSPDAAIRPQGPVELPGSPEGEDAPPHDVLAAEEFAMPAPRHHGNVSVASPEPSPGPSRAPLAAGLAAALAGAALVLLRRRRAAKRSRLARVRDRLPS